MAAKGREHLPLHGCISDTGPGCSFDSRTPALGNGGVGNVQELCDGGLVLGLHALQSAEIWNVDLWTSHCLSVCGYVRGNERDGEDEENEGKGINGMGAEVKVKNRCAGLS